MFGTRVYQADSYFSHKLTKPKCIDRRQSSSRLERRREREAAFVKAIKYILVVIAQIVNSFSESLESREYVLSFDITFYWKGKKNVIYISILFLL